MLMPGAPEFPATEIHTLPDGRDLAYCQFGDPKGHPVFYAHGGPGSRYEGAIFHDAAIRHGFRLIATDRPGMGRSTYLDGRRLLDYPRDIAALADALGIDRFGVMGWSGGGAHTTVCAHAIPDRSSFNITMAGYTSFTEMPDAASFLANRADQRAVGWATRRPRLFNSFFWMLGAYVRRMPRSYANWVGKSNSETDRAVLSEDLIAVLIADQTEAFAQGHIGVAQDARVHYVDWGFRLADIQPRIHVFHGTDDRSVPFAYAKHLADHVANCELHVVEGKGHLFPVNHQDLLFSTAVAELAG